jgi:hypothetical protein
MDADLEPNPLTEPREGAIALLRRVTDDLATAPPRQAAEALLRLHLAGSPRVY